VLSRLSVAPVAPIREPEEGYRIASTWMMKIPLSLFVLCGEVENWHAPIDTSITIPNILGVKK
jgi:hypothetical protein